MQLVEHKMAVAFYAANGSLVKTKTVDCADINQSREIERLIAQWMATGVGYSVQSKTLTCVRR